MARHKASFDIRECPKCGSINTYVEGRAGGMTKCMDCKFYCKTGNWKHKLVTRHLTTYIDLLEDALLEIRDGDKAAIEYCSLVPVLDLIDARRRTQRWRNNSERQGDDV